MEIIDKGYPEKLLDLIFDHIAEGDEVTISSGETTVLFLIKPRTLSKWLIVVEWYEGTDTFHLINVTGSAWDRMYTIMTEENGRLAREY